jgi:hypothetical protein
VRFLASIALSISAFGQQRTGEAVVRGLEVKFDVVSVNPQKWTGQGSVGVLVRGDTLDAEHVSLQGLVLEPATAPFDTIVIDHAERPDEN